MKAKELIEERWYYCCAHIPNCRYFQFLKHGHDIHGKNNDYYLIQSSNIKYHGLYIESHNFRELTPEEKLGLL